MLIHDIPYHLRHTVERLEPPIYVDLTPEECLPPPSLALGDILMVLGIIRNQGRRLRLRLDPGPARPLVESHPLVSEVLPPAQEPGRLKVIGLPVKRWGRGGSWTAATRLPISFPVGPVDQLKANPILAHSLYHGLRQSDDRPSLLLDHARVSPLAGLLPRQKPSLILYPLNPGRDDHFWQDPAWWMEVCRLLRPHFALIAVGAKDYGPLAAEVDAALAMDDPASTLMDLAWLMGRAAGFLGREGGLYHLAAAVNPNLTVVWDSMASYRYWAGQGGHHLLFSNPYVFRYPQTCRLSVADLRASVRTLALHDAEGRLRQVELPAQGWDEKVDELFGGVEALLRTVQAQREVAEEREGVRAWMEAPELRERFYSLSQAFAARAALGREPAGSNWVIPLFP